MPRLQKIYKIYSIIFIVFGLISFGFSLFSDLLGLINENMKYDAISSANMLPLLDGSAFIIIGGLLQMLAGLYGYKASENLNVLFRPIVLGVLAIAWQITGFIILMSNHYLNIRLILQLPMTFIFLVMACLVKFKSSSGLKKKHVEFNPLSSLGSSEKKIKQRNIASFFQTNHTAKKHIHKPSINTGRKIKRINIKPTRKFKR